MLGNLGLAILSFMLAMYALTVIYGLSFAVVFATKKLNMDVAKTIAYVLLLGMSTALCAAPFFARHDGNGETGGLLVILFCVIDMVLMLLFAVSRVKVLVNARRHD